MEQKKRQLIGELRLQIARAQKAQVRENEMLRNLPSLKVSIDIINKKKIDLTQSIEKRNEEIAKLEKQIEDIENGKKDKEMEGERIVQKNKNEAVSKQIKQKRKENELMDKEKKQAEQNHYFKTREPKEDTFFNSYEYFQKCANSLPSHKRENLKDMPCNKGYIWNRCWFFGDKKEEYGQPTTMFESTREGIMYIHEYTSTEYKKFEKIGKEKKKLILTVPRK